jgi:hypothetical protein
LSRNKHRLKDYLHQTEQYMFLPVFLHSPKFLFLCQEHHKFLKLPVHHLQ